MSYTVEDHRSYMIDDGEHELMANFEAEIIRETRYIDGLETQTYLTLTGKMPGKEKDKPLVLPEVEIPAGNLASMGWVLQAWGTRAVISPGMGTKDNLRAFIQMRSNPSLINIYRHTGWTTIRKERFYLHAGGAIGRNGNNPAVQLALPIELSRYNLATSIKPSTGWAATMSLLKLGPPELIWPLLAATFVPIFGQADYAIHLTGRTGTFKSEVISLFASHYGKELDARHLPGSWSSTANALEALAFLAKNTVFPLDDFVPNGSRSQVATYQATADKIIRSQGNQQGRARLTDTSKLQGTMYPRGIIMSTGEDTPEGHSVRARMLILEIGPGTISLPALTAAQQARPHYCATVAALVQHLAANGFPQLRARADEIRDQNLTIGHSRTPAMIGHLYSVIEAVLDWAIASKFLTRKDGETHKLNALDALLKTGAMQNTYLESADPVEQFTGAIRQVLGAKTGHLRTIDGFTPAHCDLFGWTTQDAGPNSMPTFKSGGPTIGWIDWDKDELYLDSTVGYPLVRKVAGADLSLSQITLLRRLKDGGLISRIDEARQRHTIRLVAEGHTRNVIVMPIRSTLQMTEEPNAKRTG